MTNKDIQIGFALHQMKRGHEYRNMISAPEGMSIIELDFSGQEFRWMAVASNDPTMLELCAEGEDAHSYMGAQIAGVDYRDLIMRVGQGDKEAASQRKLGKFANLSFQYRIGAKAATIKARVEYSLDLDERYVTGILETYKRSYPGVVKYWTDAINAAMQQGYAETFAGRRVQLRGNWRSKKESWALESTAINYPIQGTGGDQKYLALAVARKSSEAQFYFDLHDGMYFLVEDSEVKRVSERLKTMFSNLPYELWGKDFPIRFPVDCKTGKTWGQLK